jgi:hypothetical protein
MHARILSRIETVVQHLLYKGYQHNNLIMLFGMACCETIRLTPSNLYNPYSTLLHNFLARAHCEMEVIVSKASSELDVRASMER